MKKIFSKIIIIAISLSMIAASSSFIKADDETDNTQKHYIGKSVFAGNNKYSESNKIESDDIHYNWDLGDFIISGFTQKKMIDKKWVFLKKVGDKVQLSFTLLQNINKLNNNPDLTISSDHNGSDEVMGVPKQDFKHGTLIIKKTNYENKTDAPIVYTDYLKTKAQVNANKQVDLFEEGDYEVSLDYEIDEYKKILPDNYPNYKIHFKFSVRNGNCMVYPYDIETNAELSNQSYTEKGFYLDLAKSRYLNINVKREILNGDNKLVKSKDVRFNGPAKDGEKYTEEGIYTIKVKNKYTKEETTKMICVGNNELLKAYVVTGMPLENINARVKQGGKISDKGEFEKNANAEDDSITTTIKIKPYELIAAIAGAVVIMILIIVIVVKRKKNKKKKAQNKTYYDEEEEGLADIEEIEDIENEVDEDPIEFEEEEK